MSEGTGSVSLAQTNEGSRRLEDGDSCATEVETSVTNCFRKWKKSETQNSVRTKT